jgi:hypothetical protein
VGHNRQEEETPLHHSALPKLSFPKFYSENPRIWLDKCTDYFCIFNIPETMWTTDASLHMEDNAAKWLQLYKLKHDVGNWPAFVAVVEQKFGVYDYHSSIQDLLQVKQDDSVEEYTKAFQAIQFQVAMFNPGFDEMFFTTHFVNGLREEIRSVVQTHLPDSVDKAALLAKIQQ